MKVNAILLNVFLELPSTRYDFSLNNGYTRPNYLNNRIQDVTIYLSHTSITVGVDTVYATMAMFDVMTHSRLYELLCR